MNVVSQPILGRYFLLQVQAHQSREGVWGLNTVEFAHTPCSYILVDAAGNRPLLFTDRAERGAIFWVSEHAMGEGVMLVHRRYNNVG